MILKLVKTTYSEANSTVRCILELMNKPFYFVRCRDILYMNKHMKDADKLIPALAAMWQYESCDGEAEEMARFDEAFYTIREIAGEEAAQQALGAWEEIAEDNRKAKAAAAAREWVAAVYEMLDDEAWSIMEAAGYDPWFVHHGLFREFSDLHDQYRDSPRYRDYLKNWADAAFVYGFQLGVQHSTKHH
jgi:hypothetical protein